MDKYIKLILWPAQAYDSNALIMFCSKCSKKLKTLDVVTRLKNILRMIEIKWILALHQVL